MSAAELFPGKPNGGLLPSALSFTLSATKASLCSFSHCISLPLLEHDAVSIMMGLVWALV